MPRIIDLIGVPSEMGAQNGTSIGPLALKPSMLSALYSLGFSPEYSHLGRELHFPDVTQLRGKPRGKVYRQKEVALVATITAPHVEHSLTDGHIPFVLGGDHSIALGSVRGALDFACTQGKKLGLLWIDAHYDAHTHLTTTSHNANGMPLASLLGYGPKVFLPQHPILPEHVLHLGAGETDCEPEERALLESLGVQMISAKAIRGSGLLGLKKAVRSFCGRVDLVWVSLDLDAAQRSIAPGVHLQNEEGLSRWAVLLTAGHVQHSGKFCGGDIVEYKPSAEELDRSGAAKTARLATDFLLRLLSKPTEAG